MAKRTRTTRTTRTSSSGVTLNKFAFWLIIIIGVCMTVAAICQLIGFEHSERICNWIKQICFTLAMLIPVIISYRHARYKSTGWFVAWIIFTVMIVFGIVTTLIALF